MIFRERETDMESSEILIFGATMGSEAPITVVVFLAVYALIAFEWLNKAIAALLGVMTLLVVRVVDEQAVASFIDDETIELLIGMPGIVVV